MIDLSLDRSARIIISLGIQPLAPAVHALVGEEGAHGALALLKRRHAPDDAQCEFIHPQRADLSRLLRGYARAPYRFIIPGDPEWPDVLDDLPLIGLWVWSRRHVSAALRTGPVAIAGTEQPSAYAYQATIDITRTVTQSGRAIVVPFRPGVPTIALQATLDTDKPRNGMPIVVLPRGFGGPTASSLLMSVVDAGGAILSAYGPGTRAALAHHDAVDRIVAALGRSLVLVDPKSPVRDTAAATAAADLEREIAIATNTGPAGMPDVVAQLVDAGRAYVITDDSITAELETSTA